MTSLRSAAGPRPAVTLASSTAVAAAVATVAVATVPFFRFAYRAPDLHAVVESVNAVIALLVGYPVYGRFRQGRRLQDLLLGLSSSPSPWRTSCSPPSRRRSPPRARAT